MMPYYTTPIISAHLLVHDSNFCNYKVFRKYNIIQRLQFHLILFEADKFKRRELKR
jgi:hypothetical protein